MPLSLRPMTPGDIQLGMRLKTQAGWNQIPADWQRFLGLEPEGCFVAEWDGQAVATTTTCTFGPVGWIAMVLVDESFRHRGIATRLVQRALGYLEKQSVTTVRLDATIYGRPVYERIGFVAEHEFVRMQGVAPAGRARPEAAAATLEDLDLLAALDRQATGTDRRRLLERFMAENPSAVGLVRNGDSVAGYVMLRAGEYATQIGPAASLTEESGRTLGDWAFGRCAGEPVFVDVPLHNRAAIDWACDRGLTEQRRFSRMYRGRPIREDATLLWASSGPEKG